VISLHSNATNSARDLEIHLTALLYATPAFSTLSSPQKIFYKTFNTLQMAFSLQEYVIAAPIIICVVVLLFCAIRGMWVYRLWTKRGCFLKDFERLSSESKIFCEETAHVRLVISEDDFIDSSIRVSCLKIIKAAEDYDTGIQIALAAWDDMIHPSLRDCDADVEDGKSGRMEQVEVARKLEKSHRRRVIASMRKRCLEGVEKRKRLALQMNWMLDEMIAR
jgi:hypothetical protein